MAGLSPRSSAAIGMAYDVSLSFTSFSGNKQQRIRFDICCFHLERTVSRLSLSSEAIKRSVVVKVN